MICCLKLWRFVRLDQKKGRRSGQVEYNVCTNPNSLKMGSSQMEGVQNSRQTAIGSQVENIS